MRAETVIDDWCDHIGQVRGWDEERVLTFGRHKSKAQPRSGFGMLLQSDEETGLPLVPSVSDLDKLGSKNGQYWAMMVRQFMNAHYGAYIYGCGLSPWFRA